MISPNIEYIVVMATAKEISDILPDDYTQLIGKLTSDNDIDQNLAEVKELLPATPVVEVVRYISGLGAEPPQHTVDQAEAWIKEQISWQDRALTAQSRIQKKKPYTQSEAIKGDVPDWVGQKWASRLLFVWADVLRDAVLQAEEYEETI